MSDQNPTPLDEAAQQTAEAVAQTQEAVEGVVTDVVEEVATPVEEATTEAQEAAAEAAEVVEEAVQTAVEASTDVPNDMVNEVYSMVMNQLRADGTIPTPEIASEMAGVAIDETQEVLEGAVAAPDEVAAPVMEAAADAARDTIAPRREHFWYRPRRFFGREW